MGNNNFQFKQFLLHQNHSGMRLSTDAVLFGAWVNLSSPRQILDVGSGTGILSLMLAQRYADAHVHAIEIEPGACRDSAKNFEQSPWSSRIILSEGDFLKKDFEQKFDAIVSNPPYFGTSTSKNSPDEARQTARQDNLLPLNLLMEKAVKLFSENGELALVLPANREWDLRKHSTSYGLFLSRITHVKSFENTPAKRIFVQFSTRHIPCSESELIIYDSRNIYTTEFRALTGDFYLD